MLCNLTVKYGKNTNKEKEKKNQMFVETKILIR